MFRSCFSGAVAVQSSATVRSFVAYGLNRALFERRAGSSGAVAGFRRTSLRCWHIYLVYLCVDSSSFIRGRALNRPLFGFLARYAYTIYGGVQLSLGVLPVVEQSNCLVPMCL